jgi:hypothetical protein
MRDAHRLVETIPDDEKGYTPACTPGDQQVWYVTEAGFYRALGQRQPSRIPDPTVRDQVERFQNWVYHEVLPSIRKTGTYSLPSRPPLPELPAGSPPVLTELDELIKKATPGGRNYADYDKRMLAWHGLWYKEVPVLCPLLVADEKCRANGYARGKQCLCTIGGDLLDHKALWRDKDGNLVFTAEPYDVRMSVLEVFSTGLAQAGLDLEISSRSPWYPTFTTLLKIRRAR